VEKMTKQEKENVFITLKEHWENCENWQYLTQARKNYLKKEWDIITILKTKYNTKDIFNMLEFEEAKKIYNCWKKLNKLNDRILILENDFYFMEKRKKFVDNLRNQANKKEENLKQLIKKFGYNLQVVYYSWLSSLTIEKGSKLYFNFCM
jgi:hypothetical protein